VGQVWGWSARGQAVAAAPHHWMYTDDGASGGRLDFWPDGDIVLADGAVVDPSRRDVGSWRNYNNLSDGC
jgi:hypothetical protein